MVRRRTVAYAVGTLLTGIAAVGYGLPSASAATAGPITGLAGRCVDVAGADPANGTAVQLYDCNGTAAQTWTVGNSDSSIRALGKCLDVTAASTTNGAKIQLYDCNGTGAQKWTAASGGALVNTASGKCLDVTDRSSANGARLQIWTCGGTTNQQWTLPGGGTPTPTPTATAPAGTNLDDPAKKDVAMQLVSAAENSSLDWRAQFSYIEDIGDGRGYTAGIIGFCSGTGDMLELVQAYTNTKPGNVLAGYLPALRAVNGTASHAGLDPNYPVTGAPPPTTRCSAPPRSPNGTGSTSPRRSATGRTTGSGRSASSPTTTRRSCTGTRACVRSAAVPSPGRSPRRRVATSGPGSTRSSTSGSSR